MRLLVLVRPDKSPLLSRLSRARERPLPDSDSYRNGYGAVAALNACEFVFLPPVGGVSELRRFGIFFYLELARLHHNALGAGAGIISIP